MLILDIDVYKRQAQSAVGSFVNGVINDIGNLFKSEPQNAPAPEEEEDGAQEAEVKTEKESPEKPENIDLQNLLQMAPFMSKQAPVSYTHLSA